MASFLRKFRCQKRRSGRNSNSSIVRWPRRAASGFQSHLPCRGEKIWNNKRHGEMWNVVKSVWKSEMYDLYLHRWTDICGLSLVYLVDTSNYILYNGISVPRSTPTGKYKSWEWGRHRLHFEKMKTETEKLEQLGRLFSMEPNGNFGYRIYSLSRPSSGITCSLTVNNYFYNGLWKFGTDYFRLILKFWMWPLGSLTML